jgi:hypothetical protein
MTLAVALSGSISEGFECRLQTCARYVLRTRYTRLHNQLPVRALHETLSLQGALQRLAKSSPH